MLRACSRGRSSLALGNVCPVHSPTGNASTRGDNPPQTTPHTPHATSLQGESGQSPREHTPPGKDHQQFTTRGWASGPPASSGRSRAAQARPQAPLREGEAGVAVAAHVGRGGFCASCPSVTSSEFQPQSCALLPTPRPFAEIHLHSHRLAGRPVAEDERGPDWSTPSPTPCTRSQGTSPAGGRTGKCHAGRSLRVLGHGGCLTRLPVEVSAAPRSAHASLPTRAWA